MICELKTYSDGTDTIIQRIPLDCDAPEGFGEFATQFVFVNEQRQPVGQSNHAFNAPSVVDAFAMLPDLRKQAIADLTKPKIQVASPFGGENRMNGLKLHP